MTTHKKLLTIVWQLEDVKDDMVAADSRRADMRNAVLNAIKNLKEAVEMGATISNGGEKDG